MRFGTRASTVKTAGGGGVLSAPTITGITTDSGASASDGITTDRTLIISGTTAANATVEVFKDGVSIGTTTANGSGAWSFDHTATTLGADNSYAFTAKAYTPSSASSTFTVTTDSTAPTAAITYSPAGPYAASTAVTITATASEAIDSANGIKIALSGADTLAATAMTRVSSTVYTYAYTAGAGSGTTTVTLSNAKDIAGNSITSTPTSGATFTLGTNPFAGMTSKTWARYNTNYITSKGINPDPAVSDGSGGTTASPLSAGQWTTVKRTTGNAAILNAYSGGAVDQTNKRFYVWGGGHTDYGGNELVYWDIATQLWVRVEWPTYGANFSEGTGIHADGKPVSRHTYSAIEIVNGVLFASGSYGANTGSDPGYHWKRTLSGSTWTQLATPTMSVGGNVTDCQQYAYDSSSGLLFAATKSGGYIRDIQSIDPANTGGGWTRRKDHYWDGYTYGDNMTAVCKPGSRLLIMGGGNSLIYDISSPSSTNYTHELNPSWTGTDATAFKAASGAGMDYNTASGKIIGWMGGTSVYEVDPVAKTVTTVAADGSNTVTPPSLPSPGIYSKWRYVSDYGVFVLVVSGSEYVYVYKP